MVRASNPYEPGNTVPSPPKGRASDSLGWRTILVGAVIISVLPSLVAVAIAAVTERLQALLTTDIVTAVEIARWIRRAILIPSVFTVYLLLLRRAKARTYQQALLIFVTAEVLSALGDVLVFRVTPELSPIPMAIHLLLALAAAGLVAWLRTRLAGGSASELT